MRVGDDAFHLTYCTNVHPGEAWEEVFANLQQYVLPLKAELAPEQPFAVGLWISSGASKTLLEGTRLADVSGWLRDHGLYVVTLNGFPYGSFHRRRVKDDVYAPDWRTEERAAYTLRLAEILAALLPPDFHGGVSTAPLSYKPWLDAGTHDEVLRAAALRMAGVAAELARLRDRTGRLVHIDIEPEPDCLIENAEETVDFFERFLLKLGAPVVADTLGVGRAVAEERLRDHVRICYDTCHFAVEYERPADVFARFRATGIRIGRIQLSAALRAALPEAGSERAELARALEPFADSTYLHQVVERQKDGRLVRYPDLPEAFEHLEHAGGTEWRIHYHVPLFTDHFGVLRSTQSDLIDVLRHVREEEDPPYLEIETYTWEVLPAELKTELVASIRREYEWTLKHLQ